MRAPMNMPTNIRKPECSSGVQKHTTTNNGMTVGLAQQEEPKEKVGFQAKKRRSEVLHAENKSKLWTAKARPPPTQEELQKIGAEAVAAYLSKMWAK